MSIRKPWLLIVIAIGLLLTALALLYLTAPPMTVLKIEVLDAVTGEPLDEAVVHVQPQGEDPLPDAITDQSGIASFSDVIPSPSYLIRVHRVDYDLTFETNVAVPAGKETEISVPLEPHPGERLYVGLDGNRIAEIDTASLLHVQTIRLPSWKQEPIRHLQLHPTAEILYTVAGGEACIIDSRSGAVLKRFAVEGSVEGLGLTTDGAQVLITTKQQDESWVLSSFDAFTGDSITSTLGFDPMTATQFIWQPGESRVYMIQPLRRLLWVLETEAQMVVDRISTGAYPQEGVLSTDGRLVNSWSPAGFRDLQLAFLDVLDSSSGRQSLPEDSLSWALSPATNDLLLLDAGLGTLSILDPRGQEPPTLVPVGRDPGAVVVNKQGDWAYVANRGSNTISVVYLPASTVLQTIPVSGQPLWLAWSQEQGSER